MTSIFNDDFINNTDIDTIKELLEPLDKEFFENLYVIFEEEDEIKYEWKNVKEHLFKYLVYNIYRSNCDLNKKIDILIYLVEEKNVNILPYTEYIFSKNDIEHSNLIKLMNIIINKYNDYNNLINFFKISIEYDNYYTASMVLNKIDKIVNNEDISFLFSYYTKIVNYNKYILKQANKKIVNLDSWINIYLL